MNSHLRYILALVLCFSIKAFSQATTVNVAGNSSTLTIANNVQSVVDPSLTIAADGNITAFIVSITGSYTAGDVLSYTGPLPSGITAASFNATTKSLVFSGTTTAANWQTLLRTVTITTVSATCYQEQRQVSFVAGNKYYNNLNGHYYENVAGSINWASALANAATKSYFGRAGYLVTMTSLAETNFIWKLIGSDSWMGASDNNAYINAATGTTTYATNTGAGSSDGKWYWVTGPEKGTLFSVGHGTPVTQPGQFAYWNGGEPNGSNGGEDCGEFYAASGGKWNDLNFTSNLSSYIVEYGGMSTDNVSANVFFTRNLILSGAPSGTITGGNISVCSGSNSTTLTLSGLASWGTVVKWQYSYDDFLTAGTDIANTSTTHTVTNITQNTYYRAVVNTPSCTGLTTSSTRIYVSSAVAGNIVADNNTICVNANVNFTLNGNTGSVTKWQVSTSSTFASGITDIANTTTAMSYQLTAAGTYYFRAVIANCSNTVYTAAYTISCIAGTAPTGGSISSDNFCNGTNSGTLTLSGYTGTITKWQYSIDGGVVWTDISNTAATYNFSGITATRKYRALLTSGTCGTAWSAIGVVNVSSQSPSISYSVSGTQYYVLNTPITNLVLTNSGGAILAGSYSVSPSLPTGLSLGSDGTISGTPTVTSAITTYNITGTNGCGNHIASVVMATGATPTLSNFNNINKTYYDGGFTLIAPTSNSLGAFSYTSSNTAVATISGSTVTILSSGTSTITANQAADATYAGGSIAALLTVSSVAVITKNGVITTTNTLYVNRNGALSSSDGLTTNGKIVVAKSRDGLSASSAGISALQIKTDFPSVTDGVYWIEVPGYGPKQTYCLMNSAYDGGGWMLALKSTTGTTFNYSASYWTTANTLNPTDVTRNNADAKYDIMNGFLAKDVMALWPDISNVASESGSIDGLTQWSWLQNDFNTGTRITPIGFFSTANNRFFSDANLFSGKGTVFSGQTQVRFYGFNYTVNSSAKVRWGFAWNENSPGLFPSGDQSSNDVSGGIGMDSSFGNYSAGDRINCCQNATGINRSARVEIYIR